jgi:hypothetical protein
MDPWRYPLMKLKIPETSVEYLVAEITSPQDIDPQWVVAIAAIPTDQKRPVAGDWKTAEWEGNGIRLLIGPATSLALTCGKYDVWVKIDASPEEAIRYSGTLEIV